MNKLLFTLIGVISFLTGNYALIAAIPLMWWVFKDEKKKEARAVYQKITRKQKKLFAPILSLYTFNK